MDSWMMLFLSEQLSPWLEQFSLLFSLFSFQGGFFQVASTNALLNDLTQWFIGIISQIEQFSTPLIIALKDRLLPMIVEYESIWQDPLWQILALIFIVVLVFFIGSRLLSTLNQVVLYIFQNLEAVIKTLFRWVSAPFIWLYSKLTKAKSRLPKASFWQRLNVIQVRRAVKAVQYLTTQKDWRYNTPWFLLIGEHASGKNDLINAADKGRRTQLLPEEKNLKDPGSGWHFFKHAVVIVPSRQKVANDKTLLSESKDASEGVTSQEGNENLKEVLTGKTQKQLTVPVNLLEQQYAERFKYLIQLLHWYRPERPIDGLILTVSATTLLNLEDPANLQKLGENLFKQLWQSQKQTGFILPVYIVVTQCEHIEGFEEFWQAQDLSKHDEMFGWSNPYSLDTAFTSNWLTEAFTQVLADLESAKLQLAASRKKINDIDKFMLFKHYFSRIQTPLIDVLTRAFARSSFQEALPLRGIYFTGKIENKVSFVNDLLMKKVFAERHLAIPIDRKRFSTQKTLRRFQISSLVVGVVLIALMISDSIRLQTFSEDTKNTLRRLSTIQQDCTAEGIQTYHLLSNLTELSKRPLLLSMPLSWLNTQEKKEQHVIAKKLITKVLFPSLACRLEVKAKILMAELNESQEDNYRGQLEKFTKFNHLLVEYNLNRKLFIEMVKPFNNEYLGDIDENLKTLFNYLYDVHVNESVNTSASLITESIKIASFKIQGRDIDPVAIITHLESSAENLQTLLLTYAQKLPLTQLKKISETVVKTPRNQVLPASALLNNINALQDWLSQTENDWLTVTETNSPCGSVFEMLTNVQLNLLKSEFNQEKLAQVVSLFSQGNCDNAVRESLAEIQISPFGSMFEFNKENKLVISDVLKRLTRQVVALESLNFVKSTYPSINSSSEKVVAWSEVPLQELLNILINYQEFEADHTGKSKPFFANNVSNRLQQVTERLISAAQLRPSQQEFVSYLGKTDGSASEAELEKSIASFVNVSDTFIQIKRLLIQLGDNSNAIRLQQTVDKFVLQQLSLIDQLMSENRLYQAVTDPKWDTRDFTRILFNLSSDKQITNFLTGQQQRMSLIAFGYAEPLLHFLQNSGSASINNDVAQRWVDTINDLGHFQRKEPDNQIAVLNNFISETLVGLNNNNCFEHSEFNNEVANLGWFAKRKQQLQLQVSVQCQDAGDNQIIKRYLAIRSRFNQELSGKFPFAKVNQAGNRDIGTNQLKRFLQYYQQASKSLLTEMNAYMNYKANSMPTSWYDFISQMDQISDFFLKNWDDKNKQWQIPLNVEFAALPEYAKGSNQIITWTLSTGEQQLSFPNGGNKISWQAGQPVSLNLRWATGSVYGPQANHASIDPNLTIEPQQLSATFTSKGSWGLFEWLASYSADELSSLKANQQNKSLLSFNVPVGMKNVKAPLEDSTKKLIDQRIENTRSNLLLWVEFVNEKGDPQRLALPGVLPSFAPGFND